MTTKKNKEKKTGEKGGRGAPEFQPTDYQRERVAIWAACNMSHQDICIALKSDIGKLLSEPTLRKHFYVELNELKIRKRADIFEARYKAAKGGNVSAQSKLIDQWELELPKPAAPVTPDPSKPAKEKKLGKKDLAQRDAENAHKNSEWGNLVTPGARPN